MEEASDNTLPDDDNMIVSL